MLFQKRWWMFWWFIASALTAISTVAFFPAFKGTNISKVFNSLPASVQHIAGTGNSFNTIGGYISNEVFGLRAPLVIIILSIIVFNNLSVGEERKGILETQVSLPFTRAKIYFSKFIAGSLVVLFSSAGFFIGVISALAIIHYHYPVKNILELVISTAVLGLVFGLITFALNGIFGIRSIVLGISCAYAFAAYIITSLVTTVTSLKQIEKASLFHYYSTTGSFSYHNLLILGYIGLGLVLIGYLFFRKRDIET